MPVSSTLKALYFDASRGKSNGTRSVQVPAIHMQSKLPKGQSTNKRAVQRAMLCIAASQESTHESANYHSARNSLKSQCVDLTVDLPPGRGQRSSFP